MTTLTHDRSNPARPARPPVAAAALVLLALAASGCGPDVPSWGVQSVTARRSGQGERAGIEDFTTRFGLFGEGWAICVWTDGDWHSFNASWDKAEEAVRYEGFLLRGGGAGGQVAVRCLTPDGRRGR